MSDLEDDMNEVSGAADKAALFDDNEEDDDFQAGLEDEMLEDEMTEEDDAGPLEAEPAAAPTQDDRKAMLAKLVAKKKREAEEGEEGGSRKKKKKDKKKDKEGEGGQKSSRRRGGGEASAEGDYEPAPRAKIAEFDNPEDDVETAADRAFLDDDGAEEEEEEPIGSDVVEDEYEEGPPPEEAEEGEAEDEIQFGKNKRKRNRETEAQMAMVVDDKLAKMEAAAEEDMEQHEAGKPAVQKLKMLLEVDEFLAQKKYHEMFVSAGGLGVLKAWLEPYSDGSLPNVRVRGSVLKACQALPIDTHREDIKAQLKKSQLGSRVLFLSKCVDESAGNRAVARDLVQKWSRPIFYDPDMEADKRKAKEEHLRVARQMALEQAKAKEQETMKTTKPMPKLGQAGFRWHASIPMASKLDYVVEPQKDERLMAVATMPDKKETSRFDKKMREVVRKQKGTTARAAKPSVEGRTIII